MLERFKIISIQEGGHFIIDESFFKKRKNFLVKIYKDKIIEKLYADLIELKEILNLYFLIFVEPLYDVIKKDVLNPNLFQTIDHHFTFNYTPTFEKLYQSNIKTQYLHGKINDRNNNIVLGIDRKSLPEINKEPVIINFLKSYQKLILETDYKFLENIHNTTFSSNSIPYIEDTYFFFFGHSLDFSDQDYLNEIFNYIQSAENIDKKIVIIIRENNSKKKLIKNLFLIRGENEIEKLMKNEILLFVTKESHELKEILNTQAKSPYFGI